MKLEEKLEDYYLKLADSEKQQDSAVIKYYVTFESLFDRTAVTEQF